MRGHAQNINSLFLRNWALLETKLYTNSLTKNNFELERKIRFPGRSVNSVYLKLISKTYNRQYVAYLSEFLGTNI